MGQASRPRRGSLQYWPRKRADRILPSLNWRGISKKNNDNPILGFIGYKVGMKSAYVKDLTNDSMTKNKRIAIPATIIECPPMKVLSIRFYKNGKAIGEVLSNNIEKELKKKIKIPKQITKKIEDYKDYDNIKLVSYSNVKKTSIKKTPDISEIALGGSLDEKMSFAKENLGKELKLNELFKSVGLVDIRGVTKGRGNQGPVKRFGIALKSHKSEKGVRRPGSLAPWHPARVTFRTPQAGQTGMFTRAVYNSKIISMGSVSEENINPKEGFKHFGNIKTDYIILAGSVQGPSKRQLIITLPIRTRKKQEKKNYELIEIR